MTAVIYRQRPRVVVQRVLAFANYRTIADALHDPNFVFSSNDTAIAISNRGAAQKRGVTLAGNLLTAFVWELLDGTRSVEAVTELIVTRFDVDCETARRDIDVLLKAFKSYELIEEISGPPYSE